MATECYAMVRGSAIRVTGVNRYGSAAGPVLTHRWTGAERASVSEQISEGRVLRRNLATHNDGSAWALTVDSTAYGAFGANPTYWRGTYTLHPTGGPGPLGFFRKTQTDPPSATVCFQGRSMDGLAGTPSVGAKIKPNTTYFLGCYLRWTHPFNADLSVRDYAEATDSNPGGSPQRTIATLPIAGHPNGEWHVIGNYFTSGPTADRLNARIRFFSGDTAGATVDWTGVFLVEAPGAVALPSTTSVTEMPGAGFFNGDTPTQVDPRVGFATSKSVVEVRVNEVVETGNNEMLRNDEDERRLLFVRNGQTIRHTVDIDFIRCDPGVLSLISGVGMTMNAAGDIVGFDAETKRPSVGFALEVWSKLDSATARALSGPGFGEGEFGGTLFGGGGGCANPRYGYTLFPYLKGGFLTGFRFENGLVSFNLRGAQTRKASRWGVGPYDLEGEYQRLPKLVSRNDSYTTFISTSQPPVEMDGIQMITDVIDNGTAGDPHPIPGPENLEGQDAEGGLWIIEGGSAV